jgi:hypothetical protein
MGLPGGKVPETAEAGKMRCRGADNPIRPADPAH